MLKSKITTCAVAICLAMATLASPNAQAQNQAQTPTRSQMAEFRTCLARPGTQDQRETCDGPIYQACTRSYANEGSTIAITECTNAQTSVWNIVLNEIWPVTLAKLTPTAKAKLRTAQRIWITSRKADCEAEYEAYIDGTIRGPIFASCMSQSTSDRYFWLKDFSPDG